MCEITAFAPAASSSAFLARRPSAARTLCARPARTAVGPRMAEGDGKLFGLLPNPFTRKKKEPQGSTYAVPQAGAPGYQAPPKVEGSIFNESTKVEPKKGVSLPVSSSVQDSMKRGLDLLREDLLKNAPERVGVGRQDKSTYIRPQYGDPGYKPQAYETAYVSELGISPFQDDKNAVGKVGGLDAVKAAAKEVKKGKTAKEIKSAVLNIKVKVEPKVYDIPDYLKPLPEDTPRRGFTWKNYEGR